MKEIVLQVFWDRWIRFLENTAALTAFSCGQVVQNSDPIPSLDQRLSQMASDESYSTRNQYVHIRTVLPEMSLIYHMRFVGKIKEALI